MKDLGLSTILLFWVRVQTDVVPKSQVKELLAQMVRSRAPT
jgi:hypothetical protein